MDDISQDDMKSNRRVRRFHAPYIHGPAGRTPISYPSNSSWNSDTRGVLGILFLVILLLFVFGCLCKKFADGLRSPNS